MLRPGGRFYFEEVTAHALARPTARRPFDHPREDRFTGEQFLDQLAQHGLVVLGSITHIRGDFLLGAAAKPISGHQDRAVSGTGCAGFRHAH